MLEIFPKIPEIVKGKGAKTGASHDWGSFYLSQYDWLKGSHITKVVRLPNDYSYCEFVAPNTLYYNLCQNKSAHLVPKIVLRNLSVLNFGYLTKFNAKSSQNG